MVINKTIEGNKVKLSFYEFLLKEIRQFSKIGNCKKKTVPIKGTVFFIISFLFLIYIPEKLCCKMVDITLFCNIGVGPFLSIRIIQTQRPV